MTDIQARYVFSEKGADRIKRSFREIGGEAKRTSESTERFAGAFKRLLGLAGGALGAREILRSADAFNTLQVRIKTATRETNDYARVSKELFNIANRTGTELETNVEVFQRLALGAKDLGRSNTEVLKLVDSVQKLGVIGGSSAGALSAGLLQFGQAMSAGIVRAEEFNSIVENIPEVANAIAKGLGTSTGQLRNMVLEGKVLSQDVFEALLKQTDSIDDRFSDIPLNLSRSFTIAQTNLSKFFANIDNAIGATSGLANAISGLTSNAAALESIVIALGVATAAAFPQFTLMATAAAGLVIGVSELIDRFEPLNNVLSDVGEKFKQVESPFKSLQALFITAGGELTKFVLRMKAFADATLSAFITPFQRIRDIFNAFVIDLQEFIANPFGEGAIFDKLKRELKAGFTDSFKKAFKDTIDEAEKFHKLIDDEVTERILKLNGNIKEIGAISQDSFAKAQQSAKSAFNTISDGAEKSEEAVVILNEAVNESIDSIESFEEAADKLKKPFENALEDVQGAFADTFADIFRNGADGFGNFADNIKNIFSRLAGQIATLLIFEPQVIQQSGGIGGTIGRIFSGGATGGGAGGGGINLPGLGGGGGFLSGLDAFGANNLGLGLGADFVGPLQAGQGALTATSLSGLLGGATLGFGLGGLFGGGSIQSQIGGALGGAAGSFLGGTALGSGITSAVTGAIGGSLGSAIGSFVLPGIGSILGGVIGGLFAGEPPDEISGFSARLGETGLASSDVASKTIGTEGGRKLRDAADTFFTALSSAVGVDLSGQRIEGSFSKKQGAALALGAFENNPLAQTLGSQRFAFDAEDPESLQLAFAELSVAMLKNVETSGDLKTALQNIETDGRTATDILTDLEFAANFKNLGKAPEVVGQLEIASIALSTQFAEMADRARRLGLDVEVVTKALESAQQRLQRSLDQTGISSILSQVSPALAGLVSESERFLAVMKDAQKAGLDTQIIELDHNLRMQKLTEQLANEQGGVLGTLRQQADEASRLAESFERVMGTLDDAINQLRIGSLSILSPEQRLAEAQSLFESTSSRAALGDLQAAQELPGIANQFLEISRDFFGSSQGFVDSFNQVEAGLERARDTAQRQADIQQGIADDSRRQVEAIVEGFTESNANNKELIELQREGIKRALEFYQSSDTNNAELISVLRRAAAV